MYAEGATAASTVISTDQIPDASRKEDRGLCPLDPHQRQSLWNPLLKGTEQQKAEVRMEMSPSPSVAQTAQGAGSALVSPEDTDQNIIALWLAQRPPTTLRSYRLAFRYLQIAAAGVELRDIR